MSLPTWAPVPAGSPFGLQALPFGVFSLGGEEPRVGVRVGDHVLDLAPLAAADALAVCGELAQPTLNPLMATGPAAWAQVRAWVVDVLTGHGRREQAAGLLHPLDAVRLHLPVEVADYVDFYSSEDHATNVGRIFRPDADPLPLNWRHLPIGYHGRAGTVVPSGTAIVRPQGQRAPESPSGAAVFGPTRCLDIEAEVGFVVGVPSRIGTPVPMSAFSQHVFGVCLVNDWSARDVQRWESVPLGPFLGKSFATSMSHWVLPLAALEHARLPPPQRAPDVLQYLRDDADPWGLDIDLRIDWNSTTVSRPPFAGMYWTAAQQLAHLTVNGASLRTGDLFASGTVSGPQVAQRGSLLELTWNGQQPVTLDDGSRRTYLQDGDEVVISGSAPGRDGVRVGLGEVRGGVLPAEG